MSDLELNKIAAAVLLGGLVAMVCGSVADILYRPNVNPEKRGYKIEVAEDVASNNQQPAENSEPVDIAALLAKADINKGKDLAKRCVMCHTFGKGEPNRVGPNLWDIVGDKKARDSSYTYSPALKAMGDQHWTYDNLYQFLHKPRDYLPGTKMTFAGISNPQDVANLILYLRAYSDAPKDLP